ncbi:hypothetical Protein psc1_00820 [Candidatus Phytoplasma solani]
MEKGIKKDSLDESLGKNWFLMSYILKKYIERKLNNFVFCLYF